MNNLLLKSERGFATLIALLMVGMLTLLGIAALSTSDDEVNIAGNAYNEMRTFYAAEGGLEAAAAALQTEWDSTGVPPMLMPTETREINNCVVTYGTADNGPATQDVLSTGTLTGLHALVKSFTITSVAVSQNDHGKMELSQTFQTALVPLFQFAVFLRERPGDRARPGYDPGGTRSQQRQPVVTGRHFPADGQLCYIGRQHIPRSQRGGQRSLR